MCYMWCSRPDFVLDFDSMSQGKNNFMTFKWYSKTYTSWQLYVHYNLTSIIIQQLPEFDGSDKSMV